MKIHTIMLYLHTSLHTGLPCIFCIHKHGAQIIINPYLPLCCTNIHDCIRFSCFKFWRVQFNLCMIVPFWLLSASLFWIESLASCTLPCPLPVFLPAKVTSSLSDADSHASDVSSTCYTSCNKVIQHGLNLRLLISQKFPRDRIASSICDYMDATLLDENNDWYGSLPFKCCTSTDASVISRDIVQYVGGKKLNKNKPTFHFCPTTYPIRGGVSGEGFQLLVKDLQRLSIKKGRIYIDSYR